mgnify:FL=1
MAVRSETHALARPVPYLLERAYADAAGTGGQTIEAPVRSTGDGALVAPTAVGSTVTVLDPGGIKVVDAAAVAVSGSVASYTFGASVPATTASLGDGWTVIWSLVISGEVYTFRQAAILCEYVPRNVITAADLYGGEGIAELRYAVPQAQQDAPRGDGTGWGPQIDASYYDFIRKMLANGRPIWRSREPTGYREWLLSRSLQRAVETIPATEGSSWAEYRKRAYFRMRSAEASLKLQYDTEDPTIRRPGVGPILMSAVGRPLL